MPSLQCITIQQYILPATVIGIAFAIIILLVIACMKRLCCREKKCSQDNLASYGEKWKRIEYLSKKEDTRPLAIINACSLLDHALKIQGYQGENLSERLIAAQIALGNNHILNVVRLRNELAHVADMKPLDKEKTKQNLKIIRQALFDLNVSV